MEHVIELEKIMEAQRKVAGMLPKEDSIFAKNLLEHAAGIEQYILRKKIRKQLKAVS